MERSSSIFPEAGAGGHTALDQRFLFYNRVRSLLRHDMVVLDFGAGRGKWSDQEDGWKRRVTHLRGDCEKLIGFDVDKAVLDNVDIDEACFAGVGKPLPLEDHSVDMVVSWATLEHIVDPGFYASELSRVLRPGGWLCAWTPSRWSYFAIGARMIPPSLHNRLLRVLNPERNHEVDTFKTVYRLNTRRAIRKYFPPHAFLDYSHLPLTDPVYHGGSRALVLAWSAWIRCLPPTMRPFLHVFLQKRA